MYFVYIMTNERNGTLYVGVTNDLMKRVEQHKGGDIEGFTSEHGLKTLVFYESHADVQAAIAREKRIKAWKRIWKIRLIEQQNPNWDDLHSQLAALFAGAKKQEDDSKN